MSNTEHKEREALLRQRDVMGFKKVREDKHTSTATSVEAPASEELITLTEGDILNRVMVLKRKQFKYTDCYAVGSMTRNGGTGLSKRAYKCRL